MVGVSVVHSGDRSLQIVSLCVKRPPGGVTHEEAQWWIDHVTQPLWMLPEHLLALEERAIRPAGGRESQLGEIVGPTANGTDVIGTGALVEDEVSATWTGKGRVHGCTVAAS